MECSHLINSLQTIWQPAMVMITSAINHFNHQSQIMVQQLIILKFLKTTPHLLTKKEETTKLWLLRPDISSYQETQPKNKRISILKATKMLLQLTALEKCPNKQQRETPCTPIQRQPPQSNNLPNKIQLWLGDS